MYPNAAQIKKKIHAALFVKLAIPVNFFRTDSRIQQLKGHSLPWPWMCSENLAQIFHAVSISQDKAYQEQNHMAEHMPSGAM